jgi:hypothetical protein
MKDTNPMYETKFPYECTVIETGVKFIPIMINYDNEQVWWQQGQASDNGEWLDFTEVNFNKRKKFICLSKIKK